MGSNKGSSYPNQGDRSTNGSKGKNQNVGSKSKPANTNFMPASKAGKKGIKRGGGY